MSFPDATPSYTASDNSMTLNEFNHLTRHTDMQTDLIGLSGKLGTGASTPTSNTFLTGNGTGTSTWNSIASVLSIIGPYLYRVGDILESANSVNPGNSVATGGLGFGTWALHGVGRSTICIDSSDTDFDTVNETRGAKTVAGDPHTHPLSDAGQARITGSASSGADNIRFARAASAAWTPLLSNSTSLAWSGFATEQTSGVPLIGATDSTTPDATSVVHPVIVTYRWQRTA